jgi:signal peptidase II
MAGGPVPLRRWLLFWGIALGGAAFDLVTKRLIFERLMLGQAVPVLDGIIELRPTRNTGALWGIGSGLPFSGLVFAVLSLAAGAAIVWWLFVRRAARDPWLTTALGFIMAGALGNCYDRLTLGYVRDFVHVHVDTIGFNFAIFNFADNMLVLGAVALLLLALRPEPGGHAEPPTLDAADAAAPASAGQASK